MQKKLFIISAISLTAAVFSSKILSQVFFESNQTNKTSPANDIEIYRKEGMTGFDKLYKTLEPKIRYYTANPDKQTDPEWQTIKNKLDFVAQQKDSHASQLYWHTDLSLAKQAAKEQKKPILSLRLLGKLTDELSCANSRFFRAALYPNKNISAYLRTNYILHWESVRSAPVITIDNGNGEKLTQTITGNSIHYVLNSQGNLIDALPGLYDPNAFLDFLTQSQQLNQILESRKITYHANTAFKEYHTSAAKKIDDEFTQKLRFLGFRVKQLDGAKASAKRDYSAGSAATLAMSKVSREGPILKRTTQTAESLALTAKLIEIDEWRALLKPQDHQKAKLDENSKTLIAQHVKAKDSTELEEIIKNFEENIALDTLRNNALFRARIHEMLANNPEITLNEFTDQVYANLFLTPLSDPWLGLAPKKVYSGTDLSVKK